MPVIRRGISKLIPNNKSLIFNNNNNNNNNNVNNNINNRIITKLSNDVIELKNEVSKLKKELKLIDTKNKAKPIEFPEGCF